MITASRKTEQHDVMRWIYCMRPQLVWAVQTLHAHKRWCSKHDQDSFLYMKLLQFFHKCNFLVHLMTVSWHDSRLPSSFICVCFTHSICVCSENLSREVLIHLQPVLSLISFKWRAGTEFCLTGAASSIWILMTTVCLCSWRQQNDCASSCFKSSRVRWH